MTNSEPPPDQRTGQPWVHFPSPLRYPGGKLKLSKFVKLLVETNQLVDGEYAEVYAGGAAVALGLLYEGFARRIHINDLDPAVHAFWIAARDRTEELTRLVRDTPVNIDEWHRQRAVLSASCPDPLELGFATLFLNRTNRSGILTGGPIGGYAQQGEWRLDARFRRDDIERRIEKVGRHKEQIQIYGLDGAEFLRTIVPRLPERSLVYLDPPYFVKGQAALYANFYRPDDHAEIAGLVLSLERPWIVSYDDAPEIRALYSGQALVDYDLPYTAHERYRGREVVFFADCLEAPSVANPVRVTRAEVKAIRADLVS